MISQNLNIPGLYLITEAPYKIRSIQVNGGSEFILEFKNVCAELNIPLFVNQPTNPKNNGDVERGNKTFRKEFYANKNLYIFQFANTY